PNAHTNISRVERGKWKLVSRRSTARNANGGWMNNRVCPAPGVTSPPSPPQVSRARATVLPTAQLRPPACRRPLMVVAAPSLTTYASTSIRWRRTSSTCTGLTGPWPPAGRLGAVDRAVGADVRASARLDRAARMTEREPSAVRQLAHQQQLGDSSRVPLPV